MVGSHCTVVLLSGCVNAAEWRAKLAWSTALQLRLHSDDRRSMDSRLAMHVVGIWWVLPVSSVSNNVEVSPLVEMHLK